MGAIGSENCFVAQNFLGLHHDEIIFDSWIRQTSISISVSLRASSWLLIFIPSAFHCIRRRFLLYLTLFVSEIFLVHYLADCGRVLLMFFHTIMTLPW